MVQEAATGSKRFLYSVKTSGFSKDDTNLEAENKKLLQKLAEFDSLKKDNQALRSQFNLSADPGTFPPLRLLAAYVVGYKGSFLSPHTLVIDVGENDGVQKNQTVIFEKNLVGIISDVSEQYSHVLLPTSPSFSTTGRIAEKETIGIIKGGGDFMVLDRVVISDSLSKDDLILTNGDLDRNGLGVQKNIIVGKIRTVRREETKPFQSAEIVPSLNYSKLRIVYIIKP